MSGIWFGVAPRMDTKKTYLLIEIGLCAQIMITILSSIFKIFGGPT